MGEVCPTCGTRTDADEITVDPSAEVRRCAVCATEWKAPPPKKPRASSTRVARVVRTKKPNWSRGTPPELQPREPPPTRAFDPRATVKTPVLKLESIPEKPAGPPPLLADLVDPALLPRFAPLSVLDDSARDRLLLALDHSSSRLVALRVGKPEGDSLARRCAHEARLLKRVSHANVVALVDVGVVAGLSWIAYQYLEGAPLRRQLDKGPLSAREAGFIVSQLLDGLEAMHRAGYVHRELSPDRVRDSGTGLFKIMGLARALPPAGVAPLDWRIAADPRYLAPEQGQGERPGPPADVYSAGAVLYELLTGAPPFLTADQNELAMKHASDAPVAPSQRTQMPRGFDELVLRALRKSPQDRFASAREMGDALRALIG